MNAKTFISKARDRGYFASCTPEGDIECLLPADPNSMTVEIHLPHTMFGENEPLEIQTVSWGAKTPEEIAVVIKAYENALAMAEIVNEYLASR